ncbi:hypothetical protein [Hyphomonas johnsonii]|uniref:Uncharacterized protein n=1 Tax=Hyphomonas johnsonii MHS-2 TaxID=1280950 RepID=A0A059F9T0_9PROT|nr:hypothetical protein [Hyphomonas johnsonii]KCZ87357.1 hypothetical protein HJO_16962 [Hyphomonas johnsonii MHS-2]
MRADERLALDLMAAIRADAEARCAPDTVELVSVTIDVTGADVTGVPVFSPRVDRKTRTILFSGGSAMCGDQTVMNATAVYRIVSA